MAFNGYLIKFSLTSVTLPLKYIRYETYKVEPNQRLDLDSTRDTTGALHRTVLSHTATRIDFTVPPLNQTDKEALMTMLHNAMSDTQQKKLTIEYWDDEYATYKSGTFYIPDIKFTIRNIVGNTIQYGETALAFVEY